MEIEQVITVGDLQDYLHDHYSPVVANILQQAILFFSEECRKEDGKRDWKAIKERKKMGLGFRLENDTKIDTNVTEALRVWVLHPNYGRNLGTSFLDAMTSHLIGGISNPRDKVHRILDILGARGPIKR